MALRGSGRIHFSDEFFDDGVGDFCITFAILLEQSLDIRFNVYQFNPCSIIGTDVNPQLTYLASRVGRVECEILSLAMVVATSLACCLDNLPLIVGRCNLDLTADFIELYDGQVTTILRQPSVFA